MGLDEADRVGWPAVIAGAGFAGLAVASEVDEEVALLDRLPVGTHQTSACATFASTLEDLGLARSILRTFNSIYLHMPLPIRVELVDPLCTFDYGVLCRDLFAQGRSKFLLADVRGVARHAVQTNIGTFASRLLVDATGWTARLGSSVDPGVVDLRRLTYGIETQVETGEDTMHFFVDPRLIPWGAAWIFPTDRGSRVGVASYAGAEGLRAALDRLLRLLGALPGEIHGGAIPWAVRPGTVQDIFLVGDAAGLAPPLTAEGIRVTLLHGRHCGRLLDRVLGGSLPLDEALSRYRSTVHRLRGGYRLLGALQRLLDTGVDPWIGALIRRKAVQKAYLRLCLRSYQRMTEPSEGGRIGSWASSSP